MSSSGERTRKKASQAMYNELASNVRNNHSVAPIKKNGYTYNSMGITKYSAANTNSNQTAISKYSSYAERMELKRGKQFSNSAINGTENLKYDIRAGNLLQVQYKQDVYHAPLIATGDLDSSNGKIMKSDFIPYGETLTYPGFITDYSNSIFKTTGIGGSSNQQQAWVRNLTSIQHTGSHHWNKLNADEQMTGFSLTSPIQLWSAFDLNITANPTDVSGYIFNGTHRKGIIKGAVNPTLYYEIHDHINFNVVVGRCWLWQHAASSTFLSHTWICCILYKSSSDDSPLLPGRGLLFSFCSLLDQNRKMHQTYDLDPNIRLRNSDG